MAQKPLYAGTPRGRPRKGKIDSRLPSVAIFQALRTFAEPVLSRQPDRLLANAYALACRGRIRVYTFFKPSVRFENLLRGLSASFSASRCASLSGIFSFNTHASLPLGFHIFFITDLAKRAQAVNPAIDCTCWDVSDPRRIVQFIWIHECIGVLDEQCGHLPSVILCKKST
jgi:hypothetical protein